MSKFKTREGAMKRAAFENAHRRGANVSYVFYVEKNSDGTFSVKKQKDAKPYQTRINSYGETVRKTWL